MSFLNELLKKKKDLKPSETVVTSLIGTKYVEAKNEKGEIKVKTLLEKCHGFVVDENLDLQIVEVLKWLYLSSQDVAQNFDLIEKNGITHVLSIGVDLSNLYGLCKIKFKKIELLDEPTANISGVLDSCFDFIENARLEGENNKVLVHCNAGYSRAPTVIIAYLMTTRGYSLNESFKILSEKRNIKPNKGFMEQLRKLEKDLKIHQSTMSN